MDVEILVNYNVVFHYPPITLKIMWTPPVISLISVFGFFWCSFYSIILELPKECEVHDNGIFVNIRYFQSGSANLGLSIETRVHQHGGCFPSFPWLPGTFCKGQLPQVQVREGWFQCPSNWLWTYPSSRNPEPVCCLLQKTISYPTDICICPTR